MRDHITGRSTTRRSIIFGVTFGVLISIYTAYPTGKQSKTVSKSEQNSIAHKETNSDSQLRTGKKVVVCYVHPL